MIVTLCAAFESLNPIDVGYEEADRERRLTRRNCRAVF